MHTDEYEISLSREISLCRRVVKKMQKALLKKETKYGMATEVFLQLPEQSWSANQNKDFQRWRKDHRELQSWQKKLSEYEKAFQIIKGL